MNKEEKCQEKVWKRLKGFGEAGKKLSWKGFFRFPKSIYQPLSGTEPLYFSSKGQGHHEIIPFAGCFCRRGYPYQRASSNRHRCGWRRYGSTLRRAISCINKRKSIYNNKYNITINIIITIKKLEINSQVFLVPEIGLEPIRSCPRGILSPLCLPFHHFGILIVTLYKKCTTGVHLVLHWRHHPDSNWGWRCCRPLPYHLAMVPYFNLLS